MKVGRVYRLVLFVLVIVVIAVVVIIGNSNNDTTDNTANINEISAPNGDTEEMLVPDTEVAPLVETNLPAVANNENPYFITGITPEPSVPKDEILIPENAPTTPVKISSDPVKDAHSAVENLPKASVKHVVQKGDSLGLIAQKYYRRASMWKKIADANGITNPASLTLGQVLVIPEVEAIAGQPTVAENVPDTKVDAAKTTKKDTAAPSAPSVTNDGTYTVVQGDSLWTIAAKVYGNGSKWAIIYEANRKVMPKPGALSIGMKLIIPQAGKTEAAPAVSNKTKPENQPVKKASSKKSVNEEVEVINFFEHR